MGRIDHWSKVFFDKPENFADAFNHALFRGKRVIQPEELTPQNPEEFLHLLKKRKLYLERKRDLLKRVTIKRNGNCSFLLLGLEEQSYLDPTMPVRSMLDDALNYTSQIQKKKWELEQDMKDTDRAQMLAGFPLEGKLIPVIPLVVYLSDQKWTTGNRLHDILDIPDKDIARVVNDYSLNIITPATMTDRQIMRFGRELSMVLLSAKYASDKNTLKEQISRRRIFKSMEYETARLITEITNMNSRLKKKEKVNMARKVQSWSDYFKAEGIKQGIEQGIEQGIKQGIKQGVEQGIEQGVYQGQKQLFSQMESNGMTFEEIAKAVGMDVESVREIAEM